MRADLAVLALVFAATGARAQQQLPTVPELLTAEANAARACESTGRTVTRMRVSRCDSNITSATAIEPSRCSHDSRSVSRAPSRVSNVGCAIG